MRRTCRVLAVSLVLFASGCKYIEFLPFLKSPVDNSPRGRQDTKQGPAFDAAGAIANALATVDPAVDWGAYNGTLTGDRFSPLSDINAGNVATLRVQCTADLGEKAPMQSGPVAVRGTIYLTSATSTWAFDATTCQLRWRHRYRYSPAPDYDLKVNRGVGYLDLGDGPRLFRGANDGRVYALDARTGSELWNVMAGSVERGETFPAAPVAWQVAPGQGLVFIGNAGGDNYGVTGRIMAFDARTGDRVWSFDLVPTTGPANATWPPVNDRTPRAGAASWTSYALDTLAGRLYVPTGNAAPDFLADVRPGSNQHAYSIVALDARTGTFVHAWQLLERDVHDWDVAAAPMLVTGPDAQPTLVAAGKDGYVTAFDLETGDRRFKAAVSTMENVDAPLTASGTRFCPGVQGGVEWNGPSYSPATGMLYVGSIDWCTTVAVEPASELVGKWAIPWTGSAHLTQPFGVMDPKAAARGWLTAVDLITGAVRWRYSSPTPIVAGVTATAGGVVFAADLAGNVLAFDAATGAELYRHNTGQPIGGGIISYSVMGRQYVAVASGLHAPKSWQVESSNATLVVLGLP
jgi:alcohol dehydrogenase (cytochrome c)